MANESDDQRHSDDVDYIIKDLGGTFGRHQIYMYILIAIPIWMSSVFVLDYVFTTLDLDYRCRIPECDIAARVEYNPHWLEYAVPFKQSRPVKCYRYQSITPHAEQHNSLILTDDQQSCDVNSFNRSAIRGCSEDGFVYRTDEISIVNEFNITCEENQWKLALIGAVNNIARLIFMPVFGNLSDRYGRKTVMIISVFSASSFKMIRSIAANYNTYIVLEFFDAAFSAAIYPTSYLLGIESATTQDRVLVSLLIVLAYPFGQTFTAFIAKNVRNYKWLLRIISAPGFFIIIYIWLVHESLRWLLVQRSYQRAINTVNSVAKCNRLELSTKTYELIETRCKGTDNDQHSSINYGQQFKLLLKSPTLVLRFLICAFCWAVTIFVTYGLSIISVSLEGDKYDNFMIVSLAGFPAIFISYFLLTYIGRRWSMCLSLIFSGICIIASKYVDSSNYGISLALFFIAKCMIQHSLNALYMYTSELWPTNMRQSILSICSMIGRIGAVLAPLTPLLLLYSDALPHLLFSATAILSGLLILYLPETFNTKLPDTIEEVLMQHGREQKNCKLETIS